VTVSLFQLRSHVWSPRSLQSISEYENPGARLEAGFRRVLHLRLALGTVDKWATVGLPYLDTMGVLFPAIKMDSALPFPKIVPSAKYEQKEAEEFMLNVHAGSCDVQRAVFPPKSLSELCEHMKIGQYYQPLPMSSSADAKIRCGESFMCDLQFKNFVTPISERAIEEEAAKCQLPPPWTTFLIVVCSAGHHLGDDDHHLTIGSVTVLLLSKLSVEAFLGKNALTSIRSAKILADSMSRLLVSTPLKSRKGVCDELQ
jgi:hypothetical protein